MLVYEDNFGFWDIGNPEERIFFDHVQRQSVLIACERCERPVRLIPPKALCASCVSALEYGAPISMREYGSQETLLGLCSPVVRGAFFPSSGALSVARLLPK
jgi:hypothetical protein